MMSGYDRFLENLYGWSGGFFTALFQAISIADTYHLAQLSEGFPHEVDAYVLWTQVGVKAFAAKLSPDHPLVANLCKEYPEVYDVIFPPPEPPTAPLFCGDEEEEFECVGECCVGDEDDIGSPFDYAPCG